MGKSYSDAVLARKRKQSVETTERDKEFRDVLIHFYEWQTMLEGWYREGNISMRLSKEDTAT